MAARLTDYLLSQPLYGFGQSQVAQGTSTAPVRSWAEGLARALQGGIAGFSMGQGIQQAKGEQQATADRLAKAMGMMDTDPRGAQATIASDPYLADIGQGFALQRGTLANQKDLEQYKFDLNQRAVDSIWQGLGLGGGGALSAPPSAGGTDYAKAIAGVESAGQPNNGYGALGPVAGPNGDRAYGRYQVMGSNIGPWTKEILGQEMTPEQFLANPQAQEAVFKGKFGQYLQKTGNPQDAASMWFTGKPLNQAGNVHDVIGTTPQGYVAKFNANGGAQPIPNAVPGQVQPTPIPNAAPGEVTPQLAANPQGQNDTVMIRGIPVPVAELATLRGIRDPGKLSEALSGVVSRAIARTTPGTPEGDAYILERGQHDPSVINTPEYKAAYINKSKPQMAQGGQRFYPDMSAYPSPPGVQASGPGGRFEDTPGGIIDAETKLRQEFTSDPAVKNYLQVKPVFEAMQAAKEHPTMAADTNMIAALANIYSPGSGNLPRGEMYKKLAEIESLPEQFKTAIANLAGGKGMSPETRQQLINEAQTRMGPMLNEYNSRVQQTTKTAKDYGLNPEHIIVMPSQEAPKEGEGGGGKGGPIRIDINGKRL